MSQQHSHHHPWTSTGCIRLPVSWHPCQTGLRLAGLQCITQNHTNSFPAIMFVFVFLWESSKAGVSRIFRRIKNHFHRVILNGNKADYIFAIKLGFQACVDIHLTALILPLLWCITDYNCLVYQREENLSALHRKKSYKYTVYNFMSFTREYLCLLILCVGNYLKWFENLATATPSTHPHTSEVWEYGKASPTRAGETEGLIKRQSWGEGHVG